MLARMKSQKSAQTLSFLRQGAPVALRNVPPDRTLLEVLRDDLHLTATKEGCGEGDCGACTVVLGELVNGQLSYKAINSCIRLAHSVNGMAVYTAQDISPENDEQHPAQEAMVQCHGSQLACTKTAKVAKASRAKARRPICRATCAAARATARFWKRPK